MFQGASCHNGSTEKRFYQSAAPVTGYRRVHECQLFSSSMHCDRISCLNQRSSFSLSFKAADIKRVFQCNRLLYYRQQHKYLKHGVREPVASKKIILGQVVTAKIAQKEMFLLIEPIANLQMTIISYFMKCSMVKMTLT